MNTVELYRASNAVEADDLRAWLEANGVLATVLSRGSSAYPRVLDPKGHWGAVRVAEDQLERARELLESWRGQRPAIDLDALAAAGTAPAPRASVSGPPRWLWLGVAALLAWYLIRSFG